MATKSESAILRSQGFAPIADARARILILGTLPGKPSLEAGQYYAQKQNVFWKILCMLTNSPLDLSYAKKKKLLIENGIALWDVCHSAERAGSLDSNIKLATMITNDFESFLAKHKEIKRICFNGQFAEKIFRSKVMPEIAAKWGRFQFEVLPSTSPAYAAMRFEEKLAQWKIILQ